GRRGVVSVPIMACGNNPRWSGWLIVCFFFFFNDTATTEIYPLSLQTLFRSRRARPAPGPAAAAAAAHPGRGDPPDPLRPRSEEHTSELQSRENLVCRLLL